MPVKKKPTKRIKRKSVRRKPVKRKSIKKTRKKEIEMEEIKEVKKQISVSGYIYGLPGKKIKLETAPLFKRSLAFLADLFLFYIIIYTPFMQIYLGQLGITITPETVRYLIMSEEVRYYFLIATSILSVIIVMYFTLMEYFFGMSAGKLFLKLRVMSAKGKKISFLQALVRNIPKNLLFLFTVLPIDCITLFTEKKQRLTEIMMGTRVISIPEFELVAEE